MHASHNTDNFLRAIAGIRNKYNCAEYSYQPTHSHMQVQPSGQYQQPIRQRSHSQTMPMAQSPAINITNCAPEYQPDRLLPGHRCQLVDNRVVDPRRGSFSLKQRDMNLKKSQNLDAFKRDVNTLLQLKEESINSIQQHPRIKSIAESIGSGSTPKHRHYQEMRRKATTKAVPRFTMDNWNKKQKLNLDRAYKPSATFFDSKVAFAPQPAQPIHPFAATAGTEFHGAQQNQAIAYGAKQNQTMPYGVGGLACVDKLDNIQNRIQSVLRQIN